MTYTCDKCGFETDSVPEFASHKRWQHRKRKYVKKAASTKKHPDKATKKSAKVVVSKRRKQRQKRSQHIPRPENFDISGCGIMMYYDHLTFIPDFDDPSLTVEYLDKERVCLKCRKRYKLDEALRKRRKK